MIDLGNFKDLDFKDQANLDSPQHSMIIITQKCHYFTLFSSPALPFEILRLSGCPSMAQQDFDTTL